MALGRVFVCQFFYALIYMVPLGEVKQIPQRKQNFVIIFNLHLGFFT